MDIGKIKIESKEFAFNNKGVIWRGLWLIYCISFITSFISGFVYVFSDILSDSLDSVFSLLTLIITPVVTVTFYTYITKRFRGVNVRYEAELEEHKKKWWNYTCTHFMMTLFIGLWTLLFIIPGVVKALEYSQTMHIQSKNPTMGWKECMEKSKKMMDGHKMELFLLELSFIGWFILGAFTFGILYIWIVPYYELTLVNYHHALCGINTNVIDVNVNEFDTTNDVNVNMQQTSVKKCPYCGEILRADARFCQNCGSMIE